MNRKGPWEGYEAETNRCEVKCEVEVVFNERTIRPENRLGAFGERET